MPQIVRSLKRGDSDEFVNRLLTLFTTVMLGLTAVCCAAAPLFVYLYASKMAAAWLPIAIAFAFWSLPQIFFYGLYSLWGQLLNAKGSFGPYMWAPVINNVVGIAGLAAFAVVCGTRADWASNPHAWGAAPVAVLAGSSTLGVIVQALVLLVPLRRTGFRLRAVWGVRGHGLREVSTVAAWAFAGLAMGQLTYLLVSNIAAAANDVATTSKLVIATITARNTAFQVFMIPQSTIITSVTTALFTSMSMMVASGELDRVHRQYVTTQQGLAVVTGFSAAAMAAASIPVMQAVMPSSRFAAIAVFAQILTIFGLAIPFFGIWNLSQRLFLAFSDARTVFFVQIPMLIVVAVFVIAMWLWAPPSMWVAGTAVGEVASYAAASFLGAHILQKRLGAPIGKHLWPVFAQVTAASLLAGAAGWALLHMWGPFAGRDRGSTLAHFAGALGRIAVVGVVMLVLYLAVLWVARCAGLGILAGPVWAKVAGSRPRPSWMAQSSRGDEARGGSQQTPRGPHEGTGGTAQ